MKEVIYKTLDGVNPRKKEVSIEESDDRFQTHIVKKWMCKYFIKSWHESKSQGELNEWLKSNRIPKEDVQRCHILKQIDSHTGETKIVCKVIGKFYVVTGLTTFSIVYSNVLKIHLVANGQTRRTGR